MLQKDWYTILSHTQPHISTKFHFWWSLPPSHRSLRAWATSNEKTLSSLAALLCTKSWLDNHWSIHSVQRPRGSTLPCASTPSHGLGMRCGLGRTPTQSSLSWIAQSHFLGSKVLWSSKTSGGASKSTSHPTTMACTFESVTPNYKYIIWND